MGGRVHEDGGRTPRKARCPLSLPLHLKSAQSACSRRSRSDRLIDRSKPNRYLVATYQSHTGGKQMKLRPLGARALVKMVESEEQTASGIVLPDTAREKPQTAEVVTVGDSEEVKVSVGDVVVLAKYSGTEVKIEGEEHLIVDADDILGVMED